jgi:transcriptional regulator with XRE-family HTH domain
MTDKPLDASVAASLRQAILDSGISLNQLGQRTGIHHSRLSRFVREERDLTLAAVDRLCEVLGLRLTGTGTRPAVGGHDAESPGRAEAPKGKGGAKRRKKT